MPLTLSELLPSHYAKYSQNIDQITDENILGTLRSTENNKSLAIGCLIRDICFIHNVNFRSIVPGSNFRKGVKIDLSRIKENVGLWRDIKTIVHFLRSENCNNDSKDKDNHCGN